MGIIKATMEAVSGSLADQWLESIEPDKMDANTVFCKGIKQNSGQNTKGTDDLISNGTKIRVYDNQCMLLVDGGKIVDYTAEPGYYQVDNSSAPSLFNGQLKDSVKETFNRIRYGGATPLKQEVFFINLQEIRDIKFGTKTPVNYFDNFYNAELYLRAHGSYTIKIVDPLRFYAEVVPRSKSRLNFDEISGQFLDEFLEAFQTALNQLSVEGQRISFVLSQSTVLGNKMETILDSKWNQIRGIEIQSVGVGNITYDDESRELLRIRSEGAMLQDPILREGYVQGTLARGIQAAGANENGAAQSFMGVGMGMNAMNGLSQNASNMNMAQLQMQQQMGQQPYGQQAMGQQMQQPMGQQPMGQQPMGQQAMGQQAMGQQMQQPMGQQMQQPMGAAGQEWTCSCGTVNTGKFCSECGKLRPQAAPEEWTCSCGAVNKGKFCSECGKARE